MDGFCGSVRTICRGLNKEHVGEAVEMEIGIPSTPVGGKRGDPL
jgi:hypothetical protein